MGKQIEEVVEVLQLSTLGWNVAFIQECWAFESLELVEDKEKRGWDRTWLKMLKTTK